MLTIINFLKRLTFDLVRGLYFSALEYDDRMKMTKTLSQRILIWSAILLFACAVLYVLVYAVWLFMESIDRSNLDFEN